MKTTKPSTLSRFPSLLFLPFYFFAFFFSTEPRTLTPNLVVVNTSLVTNTDDAGPGSLRAAVDSANINDVPDTILFAIPGPGPHTIFLTSSQLELTDSGTFIDGQSQAGGVVIDGGQLLTDSTAFFVRANDIKVNGMTLQNFTRDGLYSLDFNNLQISNCDITGHGHNGISLRNSDNIIIDNSTFRLNGLDGIWIDNCQNPTITNNQVSENGIHGINVDDSNDGYIAGNTSINNGLAGQAQSSGIVLYNSQNNTITQNTFSDSPSEAGIFLLNESNVNIVSQNIISGNEYGIWIGGDGASGNQIFNNTIMDSDQEGILITAASNDNSIVDNEIRDNGSDAVRVQTGRRNLISGNRMTGNGGGISLEIDGNDEVAAPVICQITDNVISGRVGYTAKVHLYQIDPNNPCQGMLLIDSVGPVVGPNWDITGTFEPGEVYAITATDLNSNTSEFHCSQIPDLLLPEDSTICEGNNIVLDAGAGYVTYLWSTAETTRQILVDQENQYMVTVTSTDGCQFFDELTLNVEPLPEANAGPDRELYCNETITIDARASSQGPEFSYQWTTNDGNIVNGAESLLPSINAAGTYTLQIVNLNSNCSSSASMTVMDADEQFIAEAGADSTICLDGYFMNAILPAGTTGMWTFPDDLISGDPLDPHTNIANLLPGDNIFTWTISTAECPSLSVDEVTITLESVIAQHDAYTILAGNDLRNFDVVANDLVSESSDLIVMDLDEPISGNLIELSNGVFDYFPDIGFIGVDSFHYEICNQACNFCDEATVILTINLGEGEENAIITPNGDGRNDDFAPEVIYQFPNNQFRVFNRWGEKVYEEYNYIGGWYGKNQKGEDLPEATYYYNLILSLSRKRKLYGSITIKR